MERSDTKQEKVKKTGRGLGWLRALGQLWEERLSASSSRDMVRGLGLALAAFLLGGRVLAFSTYPLGLILLCSVTGGAFCVAAGLTAAAFVLPYSPLFSVAVVWGTLAVRVVVRVFLDLPEGEAESVGDKLRGRWFCEALSLRMACACISVFAPCLYALIVGGFQYYDLFGALFSVLLAPVGVLLLSGLFAEGYDALPPRLGRLLRPLSGVALSVALCYALLEYDIPGLSPAIVFSFLATLAICRRRGLVAGLLTALLTGALLSPVHMAVLGVACLAAYCVFDLSPLLASAVAAVAGTVCGIFAWGASAVGAAFLPLFAGTALFSLAEKWKTATAAPGKSYTVPPDERRQGDRAGEIARLAEATQQLSSALTQLEGRRGSGETVAGEGAGESYGAAALLLGELSRSFEEAWQEDQKLARAITLRLRELGYPTAVACVDGERQGRLSLLGLPGMPEEHRLSYLSRQMAKVCHFPLTPPLWQEDALTFGRRPLLHIRHSSAYHAQEEVCGDVIHIFYHEPRGLCYALICDGMGKGPDAALIAGLASLFLRKLLPAGVSPATVLSLLNSYLRREGGRLGQETSTTVDLVVIDRLLGDAHLFKCGAAPTYIKRGDSLFCLHAATAPLGILAAPDLKQLDFRLLPGDTLIMTSDGVAGGEPHSPWLLSFLAPTPTPPPDRLASALLSAARETAADDLSVVVLQVEGGGS